MYYVNGIHTRKEKGELKIFYPGDKLVPTEFELVSFPNKFVPILDEEPEVEEVNFDALNEAREKLNVMIEADEYEESVMEEARKLAKKNPQAQHTVDALTEKINEFLAALEESGEEGAE